MTEFDRIYADADDPLVLARHIAEQGEEAGFSKAAIADAEGRIADLASGDYRRSRYGRPGYTSDDAAFLIVMERTRRADDDRSIDERQLAEYRLTYDTETGDVVLACTPFGGEREIVYIAPVLA